MKKKILISGWYGHGNVGDEAILQAMIDTFNGNKGNYHIEVLSSNPRYTKNIQNVSAVHQLPMGIKGWIRAVVKNTVFETIKAIKKCDILVMGGGGFLSDWNSSVPFGWLKQMIIAKLFGKKTMLYAIGAGPFNTRKGSFISKIIINKFVDVVSVRDEESKKWLEKCGVLEKKINITADPAINMEDDKDNNLFKFNLEKNKKNIGLILTPHLQNENNSKYQNLTEGLISYLKFLSNKESINIYLLPFQQSLDYQYNLDLLNKAGVKAKTLNVDLGPRVTSQLLSALDLVVSFRLHGNILAAKEKTPFIPIIYHHKTYEFINRIGWDYYLEFGEGVNWKNVDLDIEKLEFLTEYFLDNLNILKNELKNKIIQYQETEEKNIKLFRRLINE